MASQRLQKPGTAAKITHVAVPDVNVTPTADLAPTAYPDSRSFRLRLGLILPATNTTMEHELWSIIFANQGERQLLGVGLHTSAVLTPKPDVSSVALLERFRQQYIGGMEPAVKAALLAAPQHLIMGISLEHILSGIGPIRETMTEIEKYSALSWSTWHDAVKLALDAFGARRIALITPWEKTGNNSAITMFEDLGYDVVSSFGFNCGNIQHIAHIPDWAKEEAVMRARVAHPDVDAIVQCGTNMGMINVSEKLEPTLGIPILSINAVIFWHAIRACGIGAALRGGGRLLREF